jgi:ABC-type phosphate transport system ATPase subunit
MMAGQDMIEESDAKVMMADDVMLETFLLPNPESKIKEMVSSDGCGKSNMVCMAGECDKQE